MVIDHCTHKEHRFSELESHTNKVIWTVFSDRMLTLEGQHATHPRPHPLDLPDLLMCLESNIESSAWGRLEGYMEADTDVAQADFMHKPLVAFAGWVCS